MTKRRIILVLAVFFSITVFTVQTRPRTRSSNRTTRAADAERRWRMTDAERKREAAKRRRQRKLEFAQKSKELAKVGRGPLIDRERKRKEAQERIAEIKKEFLFEKYALRATEEQWKVIKSKLEKVRHLRDLERSTVGLGLISSSGSRSVPTWKWRISWKDKAPAELTEAQKIANTLMDLVDSKNIKAEEFKKKMDALRESRSRQEKLKKQLSEAREELREVLTTRQEAALVLMHWL